MLVGIVTSDSAARHYKEIDEVFFVNRETYGSAGTVCEAAYLEDRTLFVNIDHVTTVGISADAADAD